MEEDPDWKVSALESQMKFFETLGTRPYDEIEKSNLFLLKKKVGFATCGKPSDLPTCSNFFTGYKQEELDQIKLICEKIIEKSDYDPIRFACTILFLYHNKAVCETPVFRVVTASGNIFIDAHARVYTNWEYFMQYNKLPDCEYCYPNDGVYSSNKDMLIGFARSPASGFFSKCTDCLDTAGSIASVAAASVFAAGMVFTLAPVALSAAGATAACTGVYSVSRSVGSLLDRNKHEQSIGLTDPEARSAWLSVSSSLVGIATFGALGKAHKIVEKGESLSKLSVAGLHALTASSLVFSGFGFVDSLFTCVDKYNKGILSKKDVFDLSCELLFLFNAIASAKATTNLVNNMNLVVAENPSVQKKLTKTQKRNLRKRAAKRRAKGLSYNTTNEPSKTSIVDKGISATLQLLILDAVTAYAPRLEEIKYICQSIGHDVMSWKTKEIGDVDLLSKLVKNAVCLYNKYREEISEALVKVIQFFSSNLSEVMHQIYELFMLASEEIRAVFISKVISMEEEVETLLNDAEREVSSLHQKLSLENDDSTFESCEDGDDEDGDDFNSEAKRLLTGCGTVINVLSLSCKNLEEFGNILDAVKYVVVQDFKAKISNYQNSLEAAKSASGDSFNIDIFHKALGVSDDVAQHMFSQTLQNLTAERTIYEIKSKCRDIEKENAGSLSLIWKGSTEGMFHYFGPHGSGEISKNDLLSLVSKVLNTRLTTENCKILEDKDVLMIELQIKDQPDVIVYQGITENNTASGIIFIVK